MMCAISNFGQKAVFQQSGEMLLVTILKLKLTSIKIGLPTAQNFH